LQQVGQLEVVEADSAVSRCDARIARSTPTHWRLLAAKMAVARSSSASSLPAAVSAMSTAVTEPDQLGVVRDVGLGKGCLVTFQPLYCR